MTVPCTADLWQVDVTSWRQVQMPAFVVCLPSDWTQSGSVWRRGAATIRWGIGIYGDPEDRRPGVQPPHSGAVVDTEDGGAAGNFVSRFGEMIGGSWAELFRSQRGGTYRTGVQWAEARLWLVGQAADARTADLELNIYRTVRFVAR